MGIPILGWDLRQGEEPVWGQAWVPVRRRRKRQQTAASQEMSAGWHQAFLASELPASSAHEPSDLTAQTSRDSPLFQIGHPIVPGSSEWVAVLTFRHPNNIHSLNNVYQGPTSCGHCARHQHTEKSFGVQWLMSLCILARPPTPRAGANLLTALLVGTLWSSLTRKIPWSG